MKKGIHPNYDKATITCACGNIIETRSTVTEMKIEICSSCHPFYTGQKKIVDTAGRVDRFQKMMDRKNELQEKAKKLKGMKKKTEKVNG